jgi:hypothetical protein
MDETGWRKFLKDHSRELLKTPELPIRAPLSAKKSKWTGYQPASENMIAAAEKRLGATLPPSLKSFYRVSNGWRVVTSSSLAFFPFQK